MQGTIHIDNPIGRTVAVHVQQEVGRNRYISRGRREFDWGCQKLWTYVRRLEQIGLQQKHPWQS